MSKFLDDFDKKSNTNSDCNSNQNSSREIDENESTVVDQESLFSDNEVEDLSLVNKGQLIVRHKQSPFEDIQANGVLEQILCLIFRLETDRRETQQRLERERNNFNVLKNKLIKMSEEHALALPMRVQREHEACISDITELGWHISFNIKRERQMERKCEVDSEIHENLINEINNIKTRMPLIEEKIVQETDAKNEIINTGNDVNETIKKAQVKQDDTKEELRLLKLKAYKDRQHIKDEINEANRLLYKANKRLEAAIDRYNYYMNALKESNETLDDIEKTQAKEKESTRDMNRKYVELAEDNKKLELEIFKIKREYEKNKLANEEYAAKIQAIYDELAADYKIYEAALEKKQEKYDKVMLKINEKEIDLREMQKDQIKMEK
jgi:chromosome segregation ATPase